MKGPRILLLMVLVAGMLGGCRSGVHRITSADQIKPGEVVLVGRFEIDPPLSEAQLAGRAARHAHIIHALFGEEFRVLRAPLSTSDYMGRIETPMRDSFRTAVPARDRYLLGAEIILGWPDDRVHFPGGLHYPIAPGDTALYVGTLRYCRDNFFNVSHTLLIDDFDRERQLLEQDLGTDLGLTRRLPTAHTGSWDPTVSSDDGTLTPVPLLLVGREATCASTRTLLPDAER